MSVMAGSGPGRGEAGRRLPGWLLPSSAATAGLGEQPLCLGTGNASALRGLPCVCLRSAVLPGACGCVGTSGRSAASGLQEAFSRDPSMNNAHVLFIWKPLLIMFVLLFLVGSGPSSNFWGDPCSF